MNIIKSIKLFLGFDKRKNVNIPLDPDLIKRDETIKAQQQKIQTQQSQLANFIAKEKLKKEKDKEKDKESEFNKKLKEQKADLDEKLKGRIFWLGDFYRKYFVTHKKYFKRKPLEISDKNDETVLGLWGDFGVMEGGRFCMKDNEGNLVSYGKSLNHVLYKPDAFKNMIRRGRFTIPVDKDGNWMEDLEYKEMPEPLDAEFDEETGKVKKILWSRVKTNVVKDIIASKMEIINGQQNDLERQDMVISGLKQEVADLKRTIKIFDNRANVSESELSKNLNRFLEMNKRFGDMHIQITKLTELKAMYENLIDKKDSIIDKVIVKLDMTSDPRYEIMKASLLDDLENYKAILPERIEIKQEPTPLPKPTPQPGEVIK